MEVLTPPKVKRIAKAAKSNEAEKKWVRKQTI
jgi:hypothetical protein